MDKPTDKLCNTIIKEATCPFCSILCDDLVVSNQDNTLFLDNNTCHIANKEFEKNIPSAKPKIKGNAVTLDKALEEAAKILKRSKQPLFTGLATDVAGMRATMQLAEKSGAILDHMHGDGAMRNTHVLQDLGWIMTTMAEIKNRADLVIFAGTDARQYPRFYERVIWNDKSLFKSNTKNRELIYIGDKLDTSSGKSPTGKRPTHIKCKQENIGEVISVIHTLIVGDRIDSDHIHGIKLSVLRKLAEKMKDAKYGVLVWAPGELNIPHAELTIQNFCEVIKYLTRMTRFAGFSLAGNNGGMTANQVCAWQSGFPLRVNYKNGSPEYDPHKYSTANLLHNREVDAMLWISSFNPDIKPPKADIPSIVMARADTDISYRPDVFIPIGTPGLDHAGQLFRTDNVVCMPIKQLRNTEVPSASDVLTTLYEIM